MARIFKERIDIERLTNQELYDKCRVTHPAFNYIVKQVEDSISPVSMRNHSIDHAYKVFLTLRYLATPHIQSVCGENVSVSQSSVSRVVTETLAALSSHQMIGSHIRFPITAQELRRNKEAFYGISR